jgi:hypothetical protein
LSEKKCNFLRFALVSTQFSCILLAMENQRIIHGRTITAEDVTAINELVQDHPDWSRRRLSRELCVNWNWSNAKGQLRDIACRTVLLRLHRAGEITLPVGRHNGNNHRRQDRIVEVDVDETALCVELSALVPVKLVVTCTGSDEHRLFKYLVHRHHYLGLGRVPGETISYMAFSADGRPIACLLFAAPAWKTAGRDSFIGWSSAQRETNLSFLANNTRFLILPWVKVKCLASHILSLAQHRIAADWMDKYGHDLDLLETFVDGSRFAGTCYKAANWTWVGSTVGRTRNDRQHRISTSVKDVYVYPLNRHFRRRLCR